MFSLKRNEKVKKKKTNLVPRTEILSANYSNSFCKQIANRIYIVPLEMKMKFIQNKSAGLADKQYLNLNDNVNNLRDSITLKLEQFDKFFLTMM